MLWSVRRINTGWSSPSVWPSLDTYICRSKGHSILYLFKEKKRLAASVVSRMGDTVHIYRGISSFCLRYMHNYHTSDIKVNCKTFLMSFKPEKRLVLTFLMTVWSIQIQQ